MARAARQQSPHRATSRRDRGGRPPAGALCKRSGAPDRIDGRFELLTLHVGLVLRRLVAIGGLGDDIAQDLVNSVFLHFDDTLREMALSDVSVSKRLKTMKEAFYGRNAAYAAALDSGSRADLAAALARNVFGAPSGAPGAARSPITSLSSTRRWPRRRSRISRRADSAFRKARSRRRIECRKPFSRVMRVDALPKDGQTVTIEANPAEREALAALLKLPSIEALERHARA